MIAGGCILVRRGTTAATPSRFAVYGGGFFVFAAFFSGIFWPRYFLQYYCLTPVLLINIFYGMYCLKKNINARTARTIFALSAVSVALLVRVIFKPSPFSYGFYLVVAAIPAYYLFFFHILCCWLKKIFFHFPEALFKTVLLFFFVMQALLWWNISQTHYSNKTVRLVFKRGMVYKGTMYAGNDVNTQDYVNALLYLNKNTRPDQTLVVFPDGVSMNFFTGLYNPTGDIFFLPTTLGYTTEESIIAKLDRYKVDYVVLLTRDATEYGAASFGRDYAKKIAEWVKSRYDLVKVFGDYPYTSQRGGIAIYKRHGGN
jgi:hypothetical protein